MQEGLFLYIRNVSPYEGGVFHQVRAVLLFKPALIMLIWLPGTSVTPYICLASKSKELSRRRWRLLHRYRSLERERFDQHL